MKKTVHLVRKTLNFENVFLRWKAGNAKKYLSICEILNHIPDGLKNLILQYISHLRKIILSPHLNTYISYIVNNVSIEGRYVGVDYVVGTYTNIRYKNSINNIVSHNIYVRTCFKSNLLLNIQYYVYTHHHRHFLELPKHDLSNDNTKPSDENKNKTSQSRHPAHKQNQSSLDSPNTTLTSDFNKRYLDISRGVRDEKHH